MNDSFIKTHVHSSPLSSELEAATKAEPSANSMKARIYRLIEESGAEGMTPDELRPLIGKARTDGGNTVRRRMVDLWQEGKIRHHPEGLERNNDSGNACIVWVVGNDPKKKPSRMELLKADNKRLRSLLVSHGIDPNQDELPF